MEITTSKLDHSQTIPMDLLLLADPSEEMISKYLYSGESFVAKADDAVVGAFIAQPISDSELEIKNIAVYPEFQRRGIGKTMIKYAVRYCKMEKYQSLVVKTADVSTDQITFYEKQKFIHESTVKGHFLKYYKDPIVENGKEASDQLVFRRAI